MTGAKRLRGAPWAFWLAVAALVLNGLVPIHLALDLGEALGAARLGTPVHVRHGLEWRLLALVTGHEAGDGKPDCDRHASCPALAALGVLHGLATVTPPALPLPVLLEARPALRAIAREPVRIPAASYRSRAPPLG